MWSDTAAARDSAAPVPLRRGQVWRVEKQASGERQAIVVLAPDVDEGRLAIVAPIIRSSQAGRGRVVLHEEEGVPGGGVVHVGRLSTVHRDELTAMVAALAPSRLDEIEASLRDVLGIAAAVTPSMRVQPTAPPEPQRESALPGFALPAPPPPAPPARPAPPPVDGWESTDGSARLEDHPMARLFGQSPPAFSAPDWDAPPASAGGVGDVLPELLEVVRRRLHRSSSHLEGLLLQAAQEGRSIEWTANSVRHASVRGVMQTTLDAIATEIESVASRGHATV